MGAGVFEGIDVAGVPKFEPREMRIWLVLVVACMATLAGLAVTARLACRRIRKQILWWDDYLMIFSMFWNWVVVGIGFAIFFEGVGYHAKTVGPEAIINISRWLLVTEILYVWNLCWTKLSLLTMYYRIFHFPAFKKQTIAVGCFVVMWAICISFLLTFICVPVQKLWLPELPGQCVSGIGVWLANSGATILTDVMILLLPIPQVWRLQLRTIEKVGLTFVFGLGFFAVFASSFRAWVLFFYSTADISYTLTPVLAWSEIEMSVGIISACLPTMRPIVRLAGYKLGLVKVLKLSPVSESTYKFDGGVSCRDVKDSYRSSRGDIQVPTFATPQTLRSTVESTRRSDKDTSGYRLSYRGGMDANERLEGILVETSLEWGLETDDNTLPRGQEAKVEQGNPGQRTKLDDFV